MSLMLDALKRIEAKQGPARAAAPRVLPVSEPAVVAATAEAIERDWSDFCIDDRELGGLDASIGLPPELTGDRLAELELEEIALPDDFSLEAAMSDLADLLAEARLLDQPAEAETPVAPAMQEEAVGAANNNDFILNWETSSNHEIVSHLSAEVNTLQRESEDAHSFGLDWNLQLPIETAKPPSEEAAVMPPMSVKPNFEASTDDSPDRGVVPQRRKAAHAPAEVFADAPVIEPLGSDPYAAAAWQILRQLPAGRSQVLQFTSPGDGHGKTLTLARLLPHVARTFAGSVLVVDANTRNPDLARRLDVAVTWRLTDVLSGATHWMNAVRATSLPRVSLLPGGTGTLRRHDVRTAAGLLRELAGHYDLVLIDTTSLAHEGAAQLAATCDGTCLVVRLGEASRRSVRESVRVIDYAGGRLLGYIAVDAGA